MDKNLVKIVKTFKSGYFTFSARFSHEELIELLTTARILASTIRDIPILPKWAAHLEEEVVRRSIFGTAAIEGNPLTEEQVGEILSEPESTYAPESAERGIINLKSAYDFIKNLVAPPESTRELTQALVKKLHSIITDGITGEKNTPGQYRNSRVKVGDVEHGGVYTPPKILEDVKTLMKEFIEWINSKDILEIDPIIRAAISHYHLALIHPFGDGNGRTARIVEALWLSWTGMRYVPEMLSNFYYIHKDEYFWAFSNARKNQDHDVTPFLGFVLRGLVDSQKKTKDRIAHFIRRLALGNYYHFLKDNKAITQRQYELLNVLMDASEPLSLHDLFATSPFRVLYDGVSERTARRDLQKLRYHKLLVADNGRYTLNMRALG